MPQGPKDLTRRADAIGNAVATGEIDVPAPPADDGKDRAAVARDRRQIKMYFAVEEAYCPRMTDRHRTRLCGAVDQRTEAMAPGRQMDSFQCTVCNATLETWNTTWVPTYRLISGPVRMPE